MLAPQANISLDGLGNVTDLPVPKISALMVLLTTCLKTLSDVESRSMVSSTKTDLGDGNYNESIADALAKRVRVLCWVLTYPYNHEKKARHVKATWGKRCNKLLFMSTMEDIFLPTIKLPIKEGRGYLWGKTKKAFEYIYRYHRNDADWFLKADDDTYVLVENLRFMLSKYNTSDTTYFGRRYPGYSQNGYMTGGAGYVLSKGALDRFVKRGVESQYCRVRNSGAEDVTMGICMAGLNVTSVDAYDNFGRGLFFGRTPQFHLIPKNRRASDCCADHAISFHYVGPNFMYLYDYLIYQFRPYGILFGENVEIGSNETKPQKVK